MRPFTFLTLAAAALAFSGCNYRSIDQDLSGENPGLDAIVAEDFCTDFHWAYDGDSGPDFWSLCYGTCGGDAQSPVDIWNPLTDHSLPVVNPDYEEVPIELFNNGHTIEFEYEGGSYLTLNGQSYELLQFHFHAGSEHTIRGKQYPLEVHLVHRHAATNQLAVIGVFFTKGRPNPFLDNFMGHLPHDEDDHYSSEHHVDAEDLLPANRSYFTYSGSLTTPPCSEIVTWIVMEKPVFASEEQLDAFADILHDNYRPVQPINGRVIRKHKE